MGDAGSCSIRAVDFGQSQSRKERQKVNVFKDVLYRLKELKVAEANLPGFEDELRAHFYRLPSRYALDVNVDRAEDVLLHKSLLHMAHDPGIRHAIEVRLVQVNFASGGNCSDSVPSNCQGKVDAQCSNYPSFHPPPTFSLAPDVELNLGVDHLHVQDRDNGVSDNPLCYRPMHEIIISTRDKPKLFSQLSSLLAEIPLDIQEAHAFNTIDGYSLDVFVVKGWALEETEQLKNTLVKKITEIECYGVPTVGEQEQTGIKFISNCVNIATDGSDWEIDTSLLKYENKIASVSSCDLYKGTFGNQDVAIKVLRAEHINENMQKEFVQEVHIMSKLRHKNVLQFIGACTRPPSLYIVMEYMSGGSMYDYLHKQKGVFTLPSILRVAIDVSKGMNYLHQNNIIHRDLKAGNLLMDGNGVLKVADFGVARVQVQSGVMTAETGTYRWMAPEVIEHKPYDHKVDVFSFGVVLWELLTGKLPYEHLTPLQAAVGVVQKGLRPIIPRHTHPKLVELLERCWQQDSSLRPEFSEIVEILQRLAKRVADERMDRKKGKSSRIVSTSGQGSH